jgi:hypothetical protein
MGPLTGEHWPRISEPGRWWARPSLAQDRRLGRSPEVVSYLGDTGRDAHEVARAALTLSRPTDLSSRTRSASRAAGRRAAPSGRD